MDLLDLTSITARQIYDGDTDKLNQLLDKARKDVDTWHSEMKGLKGLYMKLHKGWILQLALLFAQPFISTWLLAKKQHIMNKASGISQPDFDDEDDSFDDEDEREIYERLKQRYN